MYFAIATALFLLICAGAYAWWHTHRSFNSEPWIEPKQIQIDDSILGKCVVSLPVVGQNQSKGSVKLTRDIDGAPVEFRNSFVDETGGTDELDIAIRDLQTYFQLASDPEQMKYFKNSIPSQLEIHNLLVPESPLTESELKSTVKLLYVIVMGPTASFIFSSKKFMHGRPIYVTVSQDGNVDSVGVG